LPKVAKGKNYAYICYSTEQHSTDMDLHIDKHSKTTIQQQLINQINRAIANKELDQGEGLPSINQISHDQKISRDSVFKAYKELKLMGIVGSTPAKGYFVKKNLKKVLLLLDYFSPFKEILHNAFKGQLPDDFSIDVVFHHYNKRLFKTLLQQSAGLYDYFVVMNLDTETFKADASLYKLEPSKLMLLDIPVKNWQGLKEDKCSGVFQDFDHAVYQCLSSIQPLLSKYDRINLLHSHKLNHPTVTKEYFIRFCYDHNLDCHIFTDPEKIEVHKSQAYFVLSQLDLPVLLHKCRNKVFTPGTEVGILAYNDSPLYEFIGNGISVISTDFEQMGKKAAEFIISGKTIKETIPSIVKIRGSL
jgi:DNA-binding transcriptional regulator YhcF (GntR family)